MQISVPQTGASMTLVPVRPPFVALLVALALAGGAACRPNKPALGELPGSERTRDTLMGLPSRRSASARETVEKKVDAKRPPRTLVATDDSWCTVGEEQFAQTKIGDLVTCTWVKRAAW